MVFLDLGETNSKICHSMLIFTSKQIHNWNLRTISYQILLFQVFEKNSSNQILSKKIYEIYQKYLLFGSRYFRLIGLSYILLVANAPYLFMLPSLAGALLCCCCGVVTTQRYCCCCGFSYHSIIFHWKRQHCKWLNELGTLLKMN